MANSFYSVISQRSPFLTSVVVVTAQLSFVVLSIESATYYISHFEFQVFSISSSIPVKLRILTNSCPTSPRVSFKLHTSISNSDCCHGCETNKNYSGLTNLLLNLNR